MKQETAKDRSARILRELRARYPEKKAFDLDGRCMHFVCEVEPTQEHAEYDRAVEVILLTNPHKHLKMTQEYTVLSGLLELHVGEQIVELRPGEKYTIHPKTVHWAKSDDECWVEIYSRPGWTREDHIVVD